MSESQLLIVRGLIEQVDHAITIPTAPVKMMKKLGREKVELLRIEPRAYCASSLPLSYSSDQQPPLLLVCT